MVRPDGAQGVRWGTEVGDAAAHLGITCQRWEVWEGNMGFETCLDLDHAIQAFGAEAFVRLIGRSQKLEGLQFTFQNCADNWENLRDSVRRDFSLSSESKTDVYDTWSSGEVIHLIRDEKAEVCSLVVAGPQFGRAYTTYVLAGGLSNLATGLQP